MYHNETDIIFDIHKAFKANHFGMSQRQFSVQWLGRSPGYLAYLRSSGQRPHRTSVMLLRQKVARLADILTNSPQFIPLRATLLISELRFRLLDRNGMGAGFCGLDNVSAANAMAESDVFDWRS